MAPLATHWLAVLRFDDDIPERPTFNAAMTSDESEEAIARRVLAMLLPPDAVVFAVYRPPGDPPGWAADLVGRRIAWTPTPGAQRSGDVGDWAMSPYPPPADGSEAQPHSVPLKHLEQIEPSDPMPSGA